MGLKSGPCGGQFMCENHSSCSLTLRCPHTLSQLDIREENIAFFFGQAVYLCYIYVFYELLGTHITIDRIDMSFGKCLAFSISCSRACERMGRTRLRPVVSLVLGKKEKRRFCMVTRYIRSCCPPTDEIIWPDEDEALPHDAQDLISKLLRQNPLDRLGTGTIPSPKTQLCLLLWAPFGPLCVKAPFLSPTLSGLFVCVCACACACVCTRVRVCVRMCVCVYRQRL